MNRRTLLKGAATSSALAMLGMRRPQKSAAARRVRLIQQELPRYEIVSIYVSDEFVFANGQNWRGTARDINNAGTIFGDTVSGGVMVPTVWDASLAMSYLDPGPYTGMNINGYILDDVGTAIGYGFQTEGFVSEEESQGLQFDIPTIIWRDGTVDTEMSGPFGPGNGITSVTNTGELLGTLDKVPAFWANDAPEKLSPPAGFVSGGYRSANSLGDRAGSLYRTDQPFTGGVPFVRTASGEVALLDLPMGNSADWVGRVQAFSLGDDGSVAALVRGETDLFGYAVRYRDGVQTPIADLNGEGLLFSGANAHGVLVGQSMLNGYSIPTMWINDQPMAIADLIVPGPDLLFLDVNAINDNGAMVGTAQDSAGMYHHVVLRPV
jgi:hypothetical protein